MFYPCSHKGISAILWLEILKFKKYKEPKENICKENILAKIYFSLDDLELDNYKKIKFDLQYDQTLLYLKELTEKEIENRIKKDPKVTVAQIKKGLKRLERLKIWKRLTGLKII